MTAYHGGKQKIGKKLANVIYDASTEIEEDEKFVIKGYCEPFCGMLGVYQHIPELFQGYKPKLKYKAGDQNKSVILMWKAAKKGWKPPLHVTEKEFNSLKTSRDSALKGYAGHQYSFGGQYFKGYAPKYGKVLKNSNTVIKKISDISTNVSNVSFSSGQYTQYSNLKNFIIYCDPPYENTNQNYNNNFDSKQFYDWCRYMSENNIVFVSGYNSPLEGVDFYSIFSISRKITGISPDLKKKQQNRKRSEHLYVL